MTKKKKENVIYLVNYTSKKAKFPMINLYSLPTKCPVCNTFQEPEPISFQYNHNDDDAKVKFSCRNKSCKSSFSALYLGGGYVNKQYHFICFTH